MHIVASTQISSAVCLKGVLVSSPLSGKDLSEESQRRFGCKGIAYSVCSQGLHMQCGSLTGVELIYVRRVKWWGAQLSLGAD